MSLVYRNEVGRLVTDCPPVKDAPRRASAAKRSSATAAAAATSSSATAGTADDEVAATLDPSR